MMKRDNGKTTSYRSRAYVAVALCLLSLLMTACGGYNAAKGSEALRAGQTANTGFIITKAGMYDSADTGAIITEINKDDKLIKFYNSSLEREYTLNFDGTSKIYDKYGTSMSMDQVDNGSIVDITFLKQKRLLNSMTLSADAWEYTDNRDFQINGKSREMTISGAKYIIDENAKVYLDGKEASLMEISSVDSLTIRGLERKVYTIEVQDGHGYLRLKNEDYFLGGWIEIGSKIIRTVGEDMLIAVPIGTYDVSLSKDKVSEVKTISIDRNQETTLDLGDIEVPDKGIFGTVIFVTTPDSATMYIDGEEIDKNLPQRLEYGIHQMIAKADGYQSLTQYIKVGQESATIAIDLEPVNNPSEVTPTPVVSPTPDVIDGSIITPSVTPSVKVTPSVTVTPSVSVTPSVTVTPTPSVTVIPTPGITPTPSLSPTPSLTPTPGVTPEVTPTEMVTPSVSPSPEENVTPSVTPEADVTPAADLTPDVTPAAEITPDVTPEPTVMPSSEVIEAGEREYKVSISAPEGVSIYVDGYYAGTGSATFTKTSGNHEVILSKEGYNNKTYTISLDNSKQDESYSFADLVPVAENTTNN